jgi:hypothetical protein
MKTLKNLFLFLIVVSVASCDVGDDKELNYGNGAYVAQFPFASKTGFFLKDAGATYDYTLPIELVGGNGLAIDKDMTISYSVDTTTTFDDDDDPLTPEVLVNTAVEGLNFDFAGSATVVIPAGSTFASIPLKIYSGTLDDQNPPVLLLKLTGVEASGVNVVTSGNKGSVALTLQGTCTSDLAGTYNTYITRISPVGGPYTVAAEPITELSAGTYVTDVTGNFCLPTNTLIKTGAFNNLNAGPRGGFEFKEVCGRIAMEDQNLFTIYSATVKQNATQYAASSVNQATGVITIEYTIGNLGGTAPERAYRSVYTPVP